MAAPTGKSADWLIPAKPDSGGENLRATFIEFRRFFNRALKCGSSVSALQTCSNIQSCVLPVSVGIKAKVAVPLRRCSGRCWNWSTICTGFPSFCLSPAGAPLGLQISLNSQKQPVALALSLRPNARIVMYQRCRLWQSWQIQRKIAFQYFWQMLPD